MLEWFSTFPNVPNLFHTVFLTFPTFQHRGLSTLLPHHVTSHQSPTTWLFSPQQIITLNSFLPSISTQYSLPERSLSCSAWPDHLHSSSSTALCNWNSLQVNVSLCNNLMLTSLSECKRYKVTIHVHFAYQRNCFYFLVTTSMGLEPLCPCPLPLAPSCGFQGHQLE